MPWVDENRCIGCGICVNECSVKAIIMKKGKAVINMKKCKRCHEICPKNAIRHDSERNQKEVIK
jgi:ferredoxin